MRLPAELARAIEREVAAAPAKARARAAEELSRAYSAGESRRVLDSDAARSAYLITRLPATFAAASFALQELVQRLGYEISSLIDLGAGFGPASWAACATLNSLREITLVERDLAIIETGKRLASASHCETLRAAEWISADLASYTPARDYDLAIASYSLGELSAARREQLLARMWPRVRALAIIGPGTPRGFEHVLAARAWLIVNGAKIASPCPAEQACPLAAIKDWCHFAVRLERTALHRKLKSGELGYEDEKFSYVIATKDRPHQAAARIVRHPLHLKGHTRLELCTPRGLEQVTVARSAGATYKLAKKAKWGKEWKA